MASLTTEHNVLLSCLLDDVTGTEEIVQLRKDKCAIQDCFKISIDGTSGMQIHFTGSKSEGLELTGSDRDFMLDINNVIDIHVSESVQQLFKSSKPNKFLLVPDNEYPGFALLKCVFKAHHFRFSLHSLRSDNDDKYFGSESFMLKWKSYEPDEFRSNSQGPSLESWCRDDDISEIGTDMVPSIRCQFWPSTAIKWIDRPRHYGWPSLRDINAVVSFGFHLVAVGHHLSPRKPMQWRISLSIAERSLVWSFNHTQIQCYAVMKLILKEFIKVNSSEDTKRVLCSYFIKTLLFWQYEETDSSFWQSKNLHGCILYLLCEFSKCIEEGVLRHYFIPTFNLLEVKLTREAKRELVQLFDIVVQYDIAILSQCSSMAVVWSNFLRLQDNNQSNIIQIRARQKLVQEFILIGEVNHFQCDILYYIVHGNIIDSINLHTPRVYRFEHIIPAILNLSQKNFVKSSLATFVLRGLYGAVFKVQANCIQQGNKAHYHLLGKVFRNINMLGNDISSSRLWCATVLQQTGKYGAALGVINSVLSAIPPYALYYSTYRIKNSDVSKLLYKDTLLTRESNSLNRAKQAWLFDIFIDQRDYNFMPSAINIELFYLDKFGYLTVSPYTFAYYLMFLCYHELGQYENRDYALSQLAGTVFEHPSGERCSDEMHYSCNIVGHCCLVAGQVDKARKCFEFSIYFSRFLGDMYDKYNSAYHYLSYL